MSEADRGQRQRHAAASGWLAIPRLTVHGRWSARPVRGGRWTAVTTSGFPTLPWRTARSRICAVLRTENCPPGMKTGDQISPAGGYVGGGLQRVTDLAVSPAGDVWVMNNWQITRQLFPQHEQRIRSPLDSLRWQWGCNYLLRYGQARPSAANRASATTVAIRRAALDFGSDRWSFALVRSADEPLQPNDICLSEIAGSRKLIRYSRHDMSQGRRKSRSSFHYHRGLRIDRRARRQGQSEPRVASRTAGHAHQIPNMP